MKKVERVDESGGVHSMWSPSASTRWLNCPKSVIESQAMVSTPASGAAKEGTIAHKWCEKLLLDDASIDDVPEDMQPSVEIYVEHVEKIFDLYREPGYEVEGTVQLEQLIPGGSPEYWSCFGSADFLIYDDAQKIKRIPEVVDFKYGRHLVEVENNTQLMMYAIGLCDDIGYTGKVNLTIIQPRAAHKDGPVRTWTVTGAELKALKIKARSVLSKAHNMDKSAGDWCTYCDLAPTCEAKNQEVMGLAKLEFAGDEFEPPVLDGMSDKQVALIVQHHKAMIKWLEGVVSHASDRVKKGKKIKGTKLVRNSGRSGWKDEKAFKAMVKDLGIEKADAYKITPEGIGNIKKVLKEMYDNKPEELIEEYIVKSEGAVALVSDADGRIEYNPAASEFAGK